MRSSIASANRTAARAGAALALAAGLAAAALGAAAQPVVDVRGSNTPLPAQLPPSEQKSANDAYQEATRLARAGDRARALQVAENALRAAPRDARLRFLRGVLLTETGRRTDAIEAFETLVADYPELPEPYNNLAVLHASGGDLDKAREALESAIRALPDYALAHENLGDVYLRMGARAYEMALRVAPGSRPVQDKLTLAQELLQRIAPGATGGPGAKGPAAGAGDAQPAAALPGVRR